MTVLQDTLLRFNLHISNCRGQCYDGAGIMAGVQMVFCLRYVDDNLEEHEDTLGFYNLERIPMQPTS